MTRALVFAGMAFSCVAVPAATQEPARVDRRDFISDTQAVVASDKDNLGRQQQVAAGDVFYSNTRYIVRTQAVVDEDRTLDTANGAVKVDKGEILRGHSDQHIDITS